MPTYTSLTTLKGKDAANDLGLALENLENAPYGVGVFEIEDGSGLYEVGIYRRIKSLTSENIIKRCVMIPRSNVRKEGV